MAAAVAADNQSEITSDFWDNVFIVAVVADAWGSKPNVVAKTPARATVGEALKTPDPTADSCANVAAKSLIC